MEAKIRKMASLVVEIGDHEYQFVMPPQAPLGEAHDAVMAMKGFIVDRMVQEFKAEQEEAEMQMGEDHGSEG